VLDPFGGSGTTGQVAIEEGRKSILCELNPEYVQLMNQRLNGVTPSLWSQPMEAMK
jgi:site-specific DNA-methyltransferase (adenine-specific)